MNAIASAVSAYIDSNPGSRLLLDDAGVLAWITLLVADVVVLAFCVMIGILLGDAFGVGVPVLLDVPRVTEIASIACAPAGSFVVPPFP